MYTVVPCRLPEHLQLPVVDAAAHPGHLGSSDVRDATPEAQGYGEDTVSGGIILKRKVKEQRQYVTGNPSRVSSYLTKS